MSVIARLKKRRDFLRVAAYQWKAVTPTMVVQAAPHYQVDKKDDGLPSLRVGFTASRKVGNAVQRNRARRRLRSLVQTVCPSLAFSGEDIVLIARPSTITAPFVDLLRDFYQALRQLGHIC